MKTNDKFSNLKNIKLVTNLNQAAFNMLAMTTNYDLIKPREGNRNGLQLDRVKTYVKKIENDRFYPILGAIHISKEGLINDGHHRFEALKQTGKPVVFMIIDNYTLDEIADFNSSRSSAWKNEDNFGSALTGRSELAIIFNDLRMEFCDKYGISEKKINVGDMYGILVQKAKYFGAGVKTITRDMYFDMKFIDRARSIEYYDIIDTYASIRKRWIDKNKAYKACKVVMECSFSGNEKAVNFNLSTFRKHLETTDFRFRDYDNTEDFTNEAIRIHNIGLMKSEKAIEL